MTKNCQELPRIAKTWGDCERPCFDQLNAHILERLLLNFRHKFFVKVVQNLQLNVLKKKWRQNLNRFKSYEASK